MPTNITARCPHCDEEISDVRFNQEVREYGYASIRVNPDGTFNLWDHNCDDSEVVSDAYYSCPECDGDITADNLIPLNSEEDEGDESDDCQVLERAVARSSSDKPAQNDAKDVFNVPCICAKCKEWFIAEELHQHQKTIGSTKAYCESCLTN